MPHAILGFCIFPDQQNPIMAYGIWHMHSKKRKILTMPYANIAKQYIFRGILFRLPESEQRLDDWRMHNEIISGWWLSHPSEKYESHLG